LQVTISPSGVISRDSHGLERNTPGDGSRPTAEAARRAKTPARVGAGRIVAEAEKRAEQIGGDAYTALRDKELTWTEKAKAQQYYDSLDIEHDSQAKEKWLKRARLIAERRERAASRPSVSNDRETDEDNQEN
jgi:hypothetical protein